MSRAAIVAMHEGVSYRGTDGSLFPGPSHRLGLRRPASRTSSAALREPCKLFRRPPAKPDARSVPAEIAPALAEPAEEPLAIKLRKAEAHFLPTADNAAHPTRIPGPALVPGDGGFPSERGRSLKTLLQYALGTNWALSCAGACRARASAPTATACASRSSPPSTASRPGRCGSRSAISRSLAERPPLGAPFVAAKEWWKDNPIIQTNAQEYLDEAEQLGEAAAFGPRSTAFPPANYPFDPGLSRTAARLACETAYR